MIWVLKIFFVQFSVFLPPVLNIFISVRSVPFLSFIVPIFAWNIPVVYLIFLKRSLVFPILLFSSVSLHRSLKKPFLSLLAVLWNSAFKWVYLSFFPLPLASLLFITICKASSDNHFAFLPFFFLGMVFVPASCTMSQTSIYSSSGTLSIRSNLSNLFVSSKITQPGDLAKGLRTPRDFDFGGKWDLIAELSQDWGNRLL